MTKLSAVCIGLAGISIIAMVVVLLLSVNTQVPPLEINPPSADTQQRPAKESEKLSGPLVAPFPHEKPDGILRGLCGKRMVGGPPRLGPYRGYFIAQMGVAVKVMGQSGNTKVAGVSSGQDGAFEIHLRPGIYRVVAIYDSSSQWSEERVVTVEAGKKSEVDLAKIIEVP